MRKILVLVFIVVIFFKINAQTSLVKTCVVEENKTLGIAVIKQELNQGCWAASSQMVYNKKKPNSPIKQCEIYTTVWSNSKNCCANAVSPKSIDASCNSTLRLSGLKAKFWDIKKIDTSYLKSTVSWSDIETQINIIKSPFILSLGPNGTPIHIVTGKGYIKAKTTCNKFILVADPLDSGPTLTQVRYPENINQINGWQPQEYLFFGRIPQSPIIPHIIVRPQIKLSFCERIKLFFNKNHELNYQLSDNEIFDKTKYETVPICFMKLAKNGFKEDCPEILNVNSVKDKTNVTRYEKINEIWEPMQMFENYPKTELQIPVNYFQKNQNFEYYKLSNKGGSENMLPYKIVSFPNSPYEYYLFNIDNKNYYTPIHLNNKVLNNQKNKNNIYSEDKIWETVKKDL